jgi:hypothetical protein
VDNLFDLARDLNRAANTVLAGTYKVVEVGAVKVKKEQRKLAAGIAGAHAKEYPRSITYDIGFVFGGVQAQIGPEKRGQGNLGAILQYGSVNSPPHEHINGPAERESVVMAGLLAELGARLLGER